MIQLAWLYYWTRVEGFRPKLLWPRITPEVKRLLKVAAPAALGAARVEHEDLQRYHMRVVTI